MGGVVRKITSMMAQRSIQTAQAPSLTFDGVIRSGMPTQPPFNTTVYGMCRQSSVPSPSSPVAVESVSGAITSCGRNLFDKSKMLSIQGYPSLNITSVGFTASVNFAHQVLISFSGLTPNTNYTLSWIGTTDIQSVVYYNGYSNYVILTNNKLTFASASDGKMILRFATGGSSYAAITVINIQLEQSTTPSPYLPYRGLTYPIPTLNGIEVTDPAIANLVYTDAGETKYAVTDTWEPCVRVGGVERSRAVRRVGVRVFDGTEGWTHQAINTNTSAFQPYANIGGVLNCSVITCACTHFVAKNNSRWAVDEESICLMNNGNAYIKIAKSKLTYNAVMGLQSFLAAQYAAGTPVTVYYILATPVVTLGDPMPLETYPQTNIFTTSAVPHQIKASVLVPRHIA